MAKIPKIIKAVANYANLLPEQILAIGYTILKAMTGNLNFPNGPVDLGILKTALDTYSNLIGEAKDGGTKAITARDKQGEDVIRMLLGIAAYVELNSKDDMNKFLSSGFQPRSKARTPAQPLDQPVIAVVDQGVSGELLVSIQAVRKAKTYELHFGPVGPAGATPTSWSTLTIAKAKAAISITGLTPGTTYAFQVRAFGSLGYTEWSDSATRMAT